MFRSRGDVEALFKVDSEVDEDLEDDREEEKEGCEYFFKLWNEGRLDNTAASISVGNDNAKREKTAMSRDIETERIHRLDGQDVAGFGRLTLTFRNARGMGRADARWCRAFAMTKRMRRSRTKDDRAQDASEN